jgi:O-antigen/teichoic acid export membrane protein
MVVSIPILLGILFFSKQLLLVFGDHYASGTDILIILTFGSFFNNLANILQNSLIMSKGEREVANINIITAILAVLAYLALVPEFGIIGAGFVFLMSQLILVVWLCFFLLNPKSGSQN